MRYFIQSNLSEKVILGKAENKDREEIALRANTGI